MDTIVLQIFNGISYGSILLLIALGLSITFGLMKIINMAHGELIMIGAYTTYVIQNIFKGTSSGIFNLYFVIAIFAAFIISMLFGILIEMTIVKRLYGRPLDSLLATWGLSIILQQLARNVFGAPNVDVKAPAWLSGYLELGTVDLPYSRLFIILMITAAIIAMWGFLYKTRSGKNIRAVMQNREMAACLGIPTKRVDAYTFALGSGIAGIAGCALTLIGPIGPTIGTNYIVDAFMVVVLGGVGSLVGTAAGAFTFGIASTWLEFITNTSMGKVLAYCLVILFLQWKSKGLFAISSRSLDD